MALFQPVPFCCRPVRAEACVSVREDEPKYESSERLVLPPELPSVRALTRGIAFSSTASDYYQEDYDFKSVRALTRGIAFSSTASDYYQGFMHEEKIAKPSAVPKKIQTEADAKELVDIVLSFWAQAVTGYPGKYMKERTARRLSAKYFIDNRATKLVVKPSEDLSFETISFPLASMRDICTVEKDGKESFPPEVLGMLAPEEESRLFMMRFHDTKNSGQKKLIRLCLLAESADVRDKCLRLLPVLGVYARGEPKEEEEIEAETCNRTFTVDKWQGLISL